MNQSNRAIQHLKDRAAEFQAIADRHPAESDEANELQATADRILANVTELEKAQGLEGK